VRRGVLDIGSDTGHLPRADATTSDGGLERLSGIGVPG
jgi:hypothetical protein